MLPSNRERGEHIVITALPPILSIVLITHLFFVGGQMQPIVVEFCIYIQDVSSPLLRAISPRIHKIRNFVPKFWPFDHKMSRKREVATVSQYSTVEPDFCQSILFKTITAVGCTGNALNVKKSVQSFIIILFECKRAQIT